jgi:hypothetical protein
MAAWRKLPRSALLAIVLLETTLHCAGARADEGFLIGDSITAAMGEAIGLGGVAHHSVSLRRPTIAEHFARIPKGAVAIMSLGLNDAAIPVKAMGHHIERVIEGALATHERIVWVGPPCVLKSWDVRAKEMDDYLKARLAETPIQYVSLRDKQICQPELRTSDGEHFTQSGYRYVWQKIQRDSTYAATVITPAQLQERARRLAMAWGEPPAPRRNPRREIVLPRRPRRLAKH